MALSPQLVAELARIVGPEYVRVAEGELVPYARDATPLFSAFANAIIVVAWGVITTQKLISEHSVLMNPAYVHITSKSNSEVARVKAELAKSGVYSIGRYGSWTYCSIEDNIIEARALVAHLKA